MLKRPKSLSQLFDANRQRIIHVNIPFVFARMLDEANTTLGSSLNFPANRSVL
jgi:hypothetical protein